MSIRLIQEKLKERSQLGVDKIEMNLELLNKTKEEIIREREEQRRREREERERKRNSARMRQVRILKSKLKWNDTFAAILAVLGYLFAVVEYEDYYDDSYKAHLTESNLGTALRTLVSLTSLALIGLVTRHAFLGLKIAKEKGQVDPNKPFMQSTFFPQMVVEILINIVHSPPGINYNFKAIQLGVAPIFSFDQIACAWMSLRVYLVARTFAIYSKWCNETAEDCCDSEGCEANTMFALKAVLKEKPYQTLLVLMIVSCVLLGLDVRLFERPVYYGQSPPAKDYNYIWNGMWLIVITMTTVGYGDFFAVTHLGRIISVIACFWGVFLVSMMVVTLTVSSSFDVKESRAYEILYRLNIRQEIQKKAAFLKESVFRIAALKYMKRKRKISVVEYNERWLRVRNEMETRLEMFRETQNKLPDFEVPPVELLRQLNEKIDIDFEQVKELLGQIIFLEEKIQIIEKNQEMMISALRDCVDYTVALQDQVIRFRNTHLTEVAHPKGEL